MNLVRTRLAYLSFVLLLLAGGCGARSLLRAQSADVRGQAMWLNIQFDPAEQPLEPGELNAILPLKKDQPLRMADVRASIERLFATGRYADIQVDAEPRTRMAWSIRFLTKNSWFIGDVSDTRQCAHPPHPGNWKTPRGSIWGSLTPRPGCSRPSPTSSGCSKATAFTAATSTRSSTEDNRYQQMNIRFDVDARPACALRHTCAAGRSEMDPQRMLRATRFRRWIIHTWKPVTQTRVRQGIEGVRALYLKENRLEAKVSLESMQYDPETNSAIPTLRIDAGPRIDVRTVGAKLLGKEVAALRAGLRGARRGSRPAGGGRAQPARLLSIAGLFRRRGASSRSSASSTTSPPSITWSTPARATGWWTSRSRGNRYFDTASIRERMFLQPASFLQFPHGRYSESLLEPRRRLPSSTCTSRTAFAM